MKKIALLICLILSFSSFSQNKTRLAASTEKYPNFFYKNETSFSINNIGPTGMKSLNVDKISYVSISLPAFGENENYYILISGKVNNTETTIKHNVNSVDDFEFYKEAFESKYKRVIVTHSQLGIVDPKTKKYKSIIEIEF